MKIAVAKEIEVGERRVALIPDLVARLVKEGWEIGVEAGAGVAACFPDRAYEEAGATLYSDKAALWGEADVLLKVLAPKEEEIGLLRSGTVLVGFLDPLSKPNIVDKLARAGVTAMAVETIPRTSRAQSMDALSSQSNIAGYKAVLLGATALPKFFPMLTTAAGTIRPATVFIIGAGVAGLQAIATARRLGAQVEAFDIRPEVKEQVQSLGATFVEVKLEEDPSGGGGYAKEVSDDSKKRSQELIAKHVATADLVVTTAQVPGRRAPVLVTDDMLATMRPGSVVVDLAGDSGGNCEGTIAGQNVERHGVTIIGPVNLPSSLPIHASQLYGKNLTTLLQYLIKDGSVQLDFEDDITSGTCIAHNGEIRNARVKDALSAMTAAS